MFAQQPIDTVQTNNTVSFIGFGENPVKANLRLLKKVKDASNFKDKADAIIVLINFHEEKGNLDSIIYYGKYLFNKSLTVKDKKKEKNTYLAISANSIATGKRKKGLSDDAMKWHLKGLAYAREIEAEELVNKHKLGMGIVYAQRKLYQKALKVYDECLLNTKDKKLKSDIFRYKADIYLIKNELDKAEKEYYKSLNQFKIKVPLKKELIVLLKLGIIAEERNDTKKAYTYYNTVKEKAEKHGYYDLYFRAQNSIGHLFFVLKQYENAHIALSTAYSNAIQWDNLEYQKEIINNIRRVYLKQKDYKNAYNIMTQYLNISEKIIREQNKKEVNELEVEYETLQKENQIQVLQNEQILKESEIQRQKTLKISFLIGFLVILIPVIALLYMYYQKLQTQSKLNIVQEEVNQQKVATLLKDQELKLIKADIEGQDKERKRIAQELHDNIGGSLAGIKLQLSNTAKDDENYERIAKQIDETYHQVRDLSHTLIPQKFNDNMFTDLIEHYIENLQKDNTTQIVFSPHPEKEINTLEETLKVELFKIIKELITNAFKHAEAKQINIHLNIFEKSINLLFEDDGVGFDMKKHKKGIGLANIKSRLETLSGTIHLDSFLNRGTVIDINIPINT